jgi:hypothetical protein
MLDYLFAGGGGVQITSQEQSARVVLLAAGPDQLSIASRAGNQDGRRLMT